MQQCPAPEVSAANTARSAHEDDVKQAKALGRNRWPSRCDAAPKLLRYRLLHLPARQTRDQQKRWLHLRADWPWTDDLIEAWRAVKALTAPT